MAEMVRRKLCVPAVFTRGGWSHERVYKVSAPKGGHYTGVVQIYHAFDSNGQQLPDKKLGRADQEVGLLEVRIVTDNLPGDTVLVEAFDGVFVVSKKDIKPLPDRCRTCNQPH